MSTAISVPPDPLAALTSDTPTGTMSIMGTHGDLKSCWDRNRPEEVTAARAQFDRLKKEGYLAFRVSKAGEKAEAMTAFDPDAESVILCPPMRGG